MPGWRAHLFVLLVSPNITYSFPPSLLDGMQRTKCSEGGQILVPGVGVWEGKPERGSTWAFLG